MFGMNNFFPEIPRPFNTQYRCYPVAMLPGSERSDVEGGGKIIMPPSALDQLTRLNIVYPMLFKLTNKRIDKTTHCGVLEFVADEGKIYIPYWMMQNLMVEEGGLVQVRSSTAGWYSLLQFCPRWSPLPCRWPHSASSSHSPRTFWTCLTPKLCWK